MIVHVREPYFVYVDEAGDRGWGGSSSPFFVVSAIIVKASDDLALRATLDKINSDLNKPAGQVLHWAENIRDHNDRKHVSGLLGGLPMTCVMAILDKRSLMGSGCGLNDHVKQYNYLIRRLLERVSWYVDQRGGIAKLTFAHVRRFKYEVLKDYMDLLRQLDTSIKWRAFKDRYPIIEQPNKIRGLQVADLAAGCLYSAVNKDKHGNVEAAYLRELAPRLWAGSTRKLQTYGLHLVGANGRCHEQFPWWSEIAGLADR